MIVEKISFKFVKVFPLYETGLYKEISLEIYKFN